MPLSRVKYQLRTSFSYQTHKTALRMRDAALLLLSNSKCDARQLSGLPQIASIPVPKHTTAVRKLMVEVVSYNANEHVLLCKDEYRQRPGALQPKGKPGSATRVVLFDISTEQPAQGGSSGHSDGKVTVHQFMKV